MRSGKPDKNGMFAILLMVTKSGKRNYISLKINGSPASWDESQERFIIQKGLRTTQAKEENQIRKNNNDLIERYNQRAKEIIEDFHKTGIEWTLNQFKDKFYNQAKQGKFHSYISTHIKNLHDTGHTGNAKCYEYTLHIMELFDNKLKERVFSEIDIKYVKSLDIFLQKRNCKGNTRKYYFKALRSILNKAIQDKEALSQTYPFGKGGFSVNSLSEETEKRYLPGEYLNLIKNSCSLKPVNEYARKLFLFSYYCYGISWADMSGLKTKNIVNLNGGKYIVYKRQKTKNQQNTKPIQIKITETIQDLIKELQNYSTPLSNFLLPIVTRNYSGAQLYEHIRNRHKKYNKYLKDLASELEMETNLTSYVSRHTMAMQLQTNEVPREVISQILGHQDLQTTNTYLDSLDSSIIDEATKVL